MVVIALCLIGSLAFVAGAATAGQASIVGVASSSSTGVAVNTLVQVNSSGLRAIQIGSSSFDTDYVADEVVLQRSDRQGPV